MYSVAALLGWLALVRTALVATNEQATGAAHGGARGYRATGGAHGYRLVLAEDSLRLLGLGVVRAMSNRECCSGPKGLLGSRQGFSKARMLGSRQGKASASLAGASAQGMPW